MRDNDLSLFRDTEGRNAELARENDRLRQRVNLLQSVIDQVQDVVFATDQFGRYVLVNPAACRFAGNSAEELLGHNDELFSRLDLGQANETIATDSRTVGASESFVDVTRATGEVRRFAVSTARYETAQHRPAGTIGIARDITGQLRVEKRLIERERHLRTILDSEPECVKTLAADGTLLEMNPAGLAMIEADSLEQVVGNPVARFIVEEDRAAFEELIHRVFRGENAKLEFEMVGLKGTRRFLESHATPLRAESGKIVSLLAITRDITERKVAEETIHRAERRLRRVLDLLPAMIAVLSPDGIVIDTNRQPLEAFGCIREEVLGRPFGDFPPWSQFSSLRKQLENAICRCAAGEVAAFDIEVPTVTGATVALDVRIAPIKDSAGTVIQLVICGIDISNRKKAEQALQLSEERHRLFSEMTADLVYVFKVDDHGQGTNLLLQGAVGNSFGYPDGKLPSLAEAIQAVHPDDHSLVWENYRRVLEGESVAFELRVKTPAGETRWLRNYTRPQWDNAQDRVVLIHGAARDITERKQAEDSLRASEAMLELVLDNIPQGVFWKNRQSVYLGANRVSREAMGIRDPKAVVGLTDFDVPAFRREVAEFFVRKDEEVMQSNEAQYGIEELMTTADGTIHWLETNKIPLRDSFGVVTGILGTWQDITERKQSNLELQASRERLETLTRRLMQSQESERRHLARELHDEIGQSLTGIRLCLNAVKSVPNHPTSSQMLEEAISITDQTVNLVRNLALDLRPPMLDEIGLVAALRWCIDRQAQRSGFVGQLSVDPPDLNAPTDVANACFRIAQECLTNIARHAKAGFVRLELKLIKDRLLLTVSDDGCGFDVEQTLQRVSRGDGFGVQGMQERAELLGGRFCIESSWAGSTVHASFPLGHFAEQGTQIVSPTENLTADLSSLLKKSMA